MKSEISSRILIYNFNQRSEIRVSAGEATCAAITHTKGTKYPLEEAFQSTGEWHKPNKLKPKQRLKWEN